MKNPLRTVLFCVLLVAVPTTFLLADEASHRKAADDLLTAMKLKEVQAKAIDQMLSMMAKQNPMLQQKQAVLKKFLQECLAWDSIKDDYAKIYMEEFTEAELKEIAAFYRTPVGRKMAEKTPILTAKGSKLGMQRVQRNLPKLQQILRESGGAPSF